MRLAGQCYANATTWNPLQFSYKIADPAVHVSGAFILQKHSKTTDIACIYKLWS